MNQFTRRIIGFGVQRADVDGVALCCMFKQAISSTGSPKYLSFDNDLLFRYHQWQANLRILEIQEIKSIPYKPISHPFVERLIGTIRRDFIENVFFWNIHNLERKPESLRRYYNQHRVHQSLNGKPPSIASGGNELQRARLGQYCGNHIATRFFKHR